MLLAQPFMVEHEELVARSGVATSASAEGRQPIMKPKESPEDAHDRGYADGKRMYWGVQLMTAIRELSAFSPGDDPRIELGSLVRERADVVTTLRELCAEFGDNDWPDNLHLGDVIQKHLAQYLEELSEKLVTAEGAK